MNESKSIRLEVTDEFYLSPIVRTDKAAYLEHFADPEIAHNLLAIPFPYTEADADWWLDRCEQSIGSPMTNFALRTPSGDLIGAIGAVGALSAGAHSAEFGYWLAQSYRGRGLMPRVIRTFSDYAFLTPIETPNQAIQRTAGCAAFPLSMTSTFNQQPRALSPSVADLVSR